MDLQHFQRFKVVLVIAVVGVTQCLATQMTQLAFRHGLKSPIGLTWYSMHYHMLLGLPMLGLVLAGRRTATWPTANTSHGSEDGTMSADAFLRPVTLAELSWPARLKLLLERFWAAAPPLVRLPQVLMFFVLSLVANLSYVMALQHMSASVVSATFAAAPAFVCLLSLAILRRPHRWAEDAAALAAASGVVLAVHPWTAAGGQYAFVAVAALSPVAAALYKVTFARVFSDIGFVAVGSVLSQIGVANIFVGTPLLLVYCAISHGSVAAGFSALWEGAPWLILTASIAASLTFNVSVNYGVTVTAPIFVSIGSILSTVLNILVDAVLLREPPLAVEWGGMAVIFGSFAVLMWSHMMESKATPSSVHDGATDGSEDSLIDNSPYAANTAIGHA